MKVPIVLAYLLTVAVALPTPKDTIFAIELDNHRHVQKGQPGSSVRGTYQ